MMHNVQPVFHPQLVLLVGNLLAPKFHSDDEIPQKSSSLGNLYITSRDSSETSTPSTAVCDNLGR